MMRSTPRPGAPATGPWQRTVRMPAVLLTLLLAAFTAEPAAAQSSTPMALPMGQSVRGTLSSSDLRLDDASYYDLYLVNTSAGERVRVTLESNDFDAYLSLGQGTSANDFSFVSANDDGASGTDSRIDFVSEGGAYLIRANSLSSGSTGAYTLTVSSRGGGAAPSVQTIGGGQTVRGSLSGSDAVLSDGSYYDTYRFRGTAGDRVRVTMRSGDFDTYLAVGTEASPTMETDDDGAGGTDSQVTMTLPSTGWYVIRANSLYSGATGSYSLSVSGTSSADAGQAIFLGQVVDGRLTSSDPTLGDDSHYDLYRFDASSGDRLVISLTSEDFDPYLALGRMENGSFEVLESDDDSGSGTNARLEYVVPRSGVYLVRANSWLGGSTGDYTLSLGRR